MAFFQFPVNTGYPLTNFHNSAVNSVRDLSNAKICHRQTDRQTDGRTDTGGSLHRLTLFTHVSLQSCFLHKKSHKPSLFLVLAQYILINVLNAVFRNSSGSHLGFWLILKNAQHIQNVPQRILTLHHILNQTVQKKSVYKFLQGGLTWHSDKKAFLLELTCVQTPSPPGQVFRMRL